MLFKAFLWIKYQLGWGDGEWESFCALGILEQMVLMDYLDVLADRYILYNSLIRFGMLSAWHIVQ